MSSSDSPRFEGLILDVGDILYDASAWRRWLTDALRADGVAVSFEELVERWEALLVDVYRRRAAYWDRFDQLLEDLDVPEARRPALRQAAERMAAAVQVDRVPMDGASAALAALRDAGVRLAALSDTESGEGKVRQTLRQLDLERFFDAVVTSADIGHVKPEPAAYRAAAAAIEVSVPSCAFVGHDVDELEGAQQSGMYAIAYNYTPGAPADVYVDHFSELEQVVLSPVEGGLR